MERKEDNKVCRRCGKELDFGGDGGTRPWTRLCEPCQDRVDEMSDLTIADYMSVDELEEREQHEGDGHPLEGSE